jgi:hypothetical protein
MNPRLILKISLFSILALEASAQPFVTASAVYSHFHGAGIDGKKNAAGGVLDFGWQLGPRHAFIASLQSSRWSGAYQDETASVYGSGYRHRNFRTAFEAITLGYQFTKPLSADWSWQVAPALGLGRLKTDYDQEFFATGQPDSTARIHHRESSEFCAQLTTGFQWRFSTRGSVHLTGGVLHKNRAPDAYRQGGRLFAAQLAAGIRFSF